MIADNPLIRRFRYVLMRPRQFGIFISIYIAVLLMIFLINYSGYKNEVLYDSLTHLYKSIFYQFLLMQIFVLWVWGPFNSGSAIKEEITDKTFDFFRMLPIPARSKLTGILFGKNLIVLLLAFLNFIFFFVFGLCGRLSMNLVAQMALAIVSIALLVNSVALLSSINPNVKKSKSGVVGFILLAFFFGSMIISTIIEVAGKEGLENIQAKFYGLELPIMVLISIVVLYFWCWTLKGILRKFTREDESLFTRFGAYLFILGYEFVAMGLFYPYMAHIEIYPGLTARGMTLAFWMSTLVPIIIVPLASLRSIERYLEFAGLYAGRKGKRLRLPRLTAYSNLSLAAGLFIIWAAIAAFTTYLARQNVIEYLDIIAVILSFYLFYILLLEVNVLLSGQASKIGVLVVFILLVYNILPPILAGIFEVEEFIVHSPFAYMIYILSETERPLSTAARVISVNLLLCFVPALVVFARHLDVIKARQRM